MKIIQCLNRHLLISWILWVLIINCCTIHELYPQRQRSSNKLLHLNQYRHKAVSFEEADQIDSSLFFYRKLVLSFNKVGNPDSSAYFQNEITRVLIENDSLRKAIDNLHVTKEFIFKNLTGQNINMAHWYLYKGKVYYNKGDYQKSIIYYDSSLTIMELNNHPYGELYSQVLARKGLSFKELAKYTNAINCFVTSAGFYASDINQYFQELIKRNIQIGKVYSLLFEVDSSKNYLMRALSLTRRYDSVSYNIIQELYESLAVHYLKSNMQDSALFYINENIRISKDHTQSAFYEGQAYNLLGIIFKNRGEFFKAINYYKKNIHIYDSALGYMHINSAHSRENLGSLYSDLMDFDSSSKYYESALMIRLRDMPENSPAIGNSYLNMGNMCYYKSDFAQALENYKKAASIYVEAYGEDHIYVGYAIGNAGVALNNLGQYKEALVYLNQAHIIDHRNTRSLLNMGVSWARLDNFDSAFYYLDLCLESRLHKYSNSHPEIASVYYHMGLVYQIMNNSLKAIQSFAEAERIYSDYYGSNHNQIAMCCLHSGEMYLKEDSVEKAIHSYQKGLIAIAPGFKSNNVFDNPDITKDKILLDKTFIDLIKAKAEAFYQKYVLVSKKNKDLEESYKLYLNCIDYIPQISRDYKNEATRLKLYADYSDIYSDALSIHFELFENENQDGAFSIAESGKSQLLYETILESLALAGANISEENKIEERQLRQKINLVEDAILEKLQAKNGVDSLEFSNLENDLFDLKMKYDRYKKMMENNYPEYYDLKYNTTVATLSEIKDNLLENQVLLEYSLGDSEVFVFAISKRNSILKKIQIDSTFISLISEFRTLNLKSQLDSTDWRNYLDISYQLYSVLIKPLENQIGNFELVIIPDKEIGYIPFETLITSQISPQNINFSALPWLIVNHPISYTYSATLFSYSKKKKASKNKMEVLAFAPFSREHATQYDQTTLSLLREKGIEDMELAGASNEVKAISKLFNTDIFFDSTATEKRFWESSGNYNIIHIASHGIIDDENPSYSKLLFRKNLKDSVYDGKVHTFELFEKQLNAQLVVLSACNTGMGKIHKSEGVMSLARGFLYTGVPSIVMTLWSVDDQSSAVLMSNFYSYLKDGKPKDEALRLAKLDYISNTKNPEKLHPRYWAGYVLIGDNSSIVTANSTRNLLVLIFIITSIGLALFFVQKKRRSK